MMVSSIRRPPALSFPPLLRRRPPTFSFPNPLPSSRPRLHVSFFSLPVGSPAVDSASASSPAFDPASASSPPVGSPAVDSASASSPLVSSLAPAQPLLAVRWNISRNHFFFLNALLSLTAISTAWLFFSAIPALLAFKRACESLEKLLDVTREELPDTMAAVRLSGMEISDLTMELSDLGEEITQGVRNSTRVIRVAHDKLRYLTNMTPSGESQSKGRDKRPRNS